MIYLDNAATTFPKPNCLLKEMSKCMQYYCGNPGRSGHALSLKSAEKIYECREKLSNFFGNNSPENVVFTLNTTYALNLAIKSLCPKKCHILISNMEHNATFRPIFALKNEGVADFSFFNVLQPTEKILSELEQKANANTMLLVMTHASNVSGNVFPIKEIGDFCKRKHITFIVDAAQSAGVSNINMQTVGIDALCFPAHKGLYGPQGLGAVIFGDKKPIRTIIEGGNGFNSLSPKMGDELPEAFEAGTMPTPQIVGLLASLRWLESIGTENIKAHECRLANMLTEMMLSFKGSVVYSPLQAQSGIVLYNNQFLTDDVISSILNQNDICIRSGFHCSPLAHNSLNTSKSGAIRFSIGFFNTEKEIDTVYKTMKRLLK